MNFVVLLKQVPDVTSIPPQAWDTDKGILRRGLLDNVLNPLDLHAITLACQIRSEMAPASKASPAPAGPDVRPMSTKQSEGEGRIVCLTMGPPAAGEVLLDAIARGADEGILLTDPAFAGSDTIATAYAIARAVARIERELFAGDRRYLVLAGMQSTDGDTAQVPAQVAQALDMDLLAYATHVESKDGLVVRRIGPTGSETLRARTFPAMITVTDCTEPLFRSFARARQAHNRPRPYETWSANDIQADPAAIGLEGSRTQVVKIFSAKKVNKQCHFVENAAELVGLIEQRLEGQDESAAPAGEAYRLGDKSPAYSGQVWTFVEAHGQAVLPVSLELLGKARELADSLRQAVGAVLIGSGVAGLADQLLARGADKVYLADRPELAICRSLSYRGVIVNLMRQHRPQIMLFGATPFGRELAPRVAYALNSGLTADCTQLEIGDHAGRCGLLLQTRPALGGNIIATIVSKNCTTQMATVRPGVFHPLPETWRGRVPWLRCVQPCPPTKFGARHGRVENGACDGCPHADGRALWQSMAAENAAMAPGHETHGRDAHATAEAIIPYTGPVEPERAELLSIEPAKDRKNLSEADIIVSGGAGLRGEGFDQYLRPLAKALSLRLGADAELGASRRAVEQGKIAREHQVGQTGQTVEPSVYFAVGISGAVQHISGMQKSKVVVAINSNPKAPIFRIADLGFVGKAEQVIPQLLAALERRP